MRRTSFICSVVISAAAVALGSHASAAEAAGRGVKISAENVAKLQKVEGLRRFGLQAACMTRGEKSVAGALRRDRFVSLAKISRERDSRAFRKAALEVRQTCADIQQGVSAAGPAPQPPAGDAPSASPGSDPGASAPINPGASAPSNPGASAPADPGATPPAAPAPSSPPAAPTPAAAIPPIPELAQWESQMKSFGARHCDTLRNPSKSYDEKLNATYYDSEWVYYQIADYTRDTSWMSCAAAAEAVYRDRYVLGASGKVPGYWNFSHGLLQDYLRSGDETSRSAVRMLSKDAAYTPDTTPLAWTETAEFSREVAYAIMAYLNAEDVGEPRRERLAAFVNQALGHYDQWFVTRNAPYVRPFMAGLTTHALISYWEKTPDPRILPAVKTALDWLWDNTWVQSAGAFKYTDREVSSGGTNPAPDLNMLIAPAYAWTWHQTGEAKYRDRADAIFSGGVKGAFLSNGKQFNQNYRWSFDFIKWRSQAPLR